VSGVYIAKAVRDSGNFGTSHIVFVVRDDARRSDLLFQTSDTTWEAYNTYGGYGSYIGTSNGHQAYYMSYNCSFNTRSSFGGQSWVFNAEYPMIRFLEANGYDMSYTTGGDVDANGAVLRNHKVFMSVGHDEYWSAQQRANVQAARDASVNLAFLSGDEIYWKTRWLDNNSWLITYKESLVGFSPSPGKLDPSPIWTGLWRDPRFSPPSNGGRPENQLSGTLYTSQSTGAIQVPAEEGRDRLWRNTSMAAMAPGTVAALPSGTLGYEWDEDIDTGAIAQLIGVAPAGARFRPPGEIRLSSTQPPLSTQVNSQDREAQAPNVSQGSAGSVHSQRTVAATHHVTLYRAPSGALVFSAGTVQWSWGLDSHHDNGSAPADPRMQQATINVLADMGSQPQTLLPGLVPATASTDTTPPTSTIVTPTTGG
jgi:hypothetical protein